MKSLRYNPDMQSVHRTGAVTSIKVISAPRRIGKNTFSC